MTGYMSADKVIAIQVPWNATPAEAAKLLAEAQAAADAEA
ncbi:hypothetical protein PBI_JOHANN_9 [Microbacterium phage Johann]|uniref:Uncharacterized protein n=2 Tax=Goodmanvirus goodman TaxID=2734238 RepID=A0A3G3M0L8_9CAUD|nr:hypothetical protein HOU56_gp09 [Microbacterium phage Goodman]AYQ99465.1 hypothetical protein PBI_GOODMAN_9 [Microbacterium phage Goodman]AYQ99633.1 hypothetical protein PBI_JOHANN_9 [Microbacterium phage Johann]